MKASCITTSEVAKTQVKKVKNKLGKVPTNVVLAIIAAIVILGGLYMYTGGKAPATIGAPPQTVGTATGGAVSAGCSANPVLSLSGIDSLGTVSIVGTGLFKVGNAYPTSVATATTAAATAPAGSSVQYWVSNASLFCAPITVPNIQCSANAPIQDGCKVNGTATLTAYTDTYTALTSGGGANNITVTTSPVTFIARVAATKYQSFAPFGGCVVVEVPSTTSSVDISNGGALQSGCAGYTLSYTMSSTANSAFYFTLPANFDDGSGIQTDLRVRITPSVDQSGTGRITFFPSNYYLALDGNFYNDIQQVKNGVTTRTIASNPSFTFGIN